VNLLAQDHRPKPRLSTKAGEPHRGRAAGIIVVAATQKPSGDVVPTALRDLFGFRWAFRCSTRDASDTILGAGWATLGYSAATIAGDQRGVGYLLAEGQVPVRLRSYYLADDDLRVLAERAVLLRAAWADLHDLPDEDDPPALGVVA
jgi:DNA segregation ATPase FtsK/SpoIIIE, S-DNA-T family